MLRKIVTVLILVPLALAIVMFAVANRAPVVLGLIAGVIVGGAAAGSRQSMWRRRARRLSADLKAARGEIETLRHQLEASAAAHAQAQNSIAAIAYRHPSAA